MPRPRQLVPELSVPTVGSGTWNHADQAPQHFTLIAFYRGLHCPIGHADRAELNRLHAEFAARGVGVVGISSDSTERAGQAVRDLSLGQQAVSHGLTIDQAREWGLYISSGHGRSSLGIDEPAPFSEPGIFLVRPDRTLYFATVQTMPFARPHFNEMLPAIDDVLKTDYPARGKA